MKILYISTNRINEKNDGSLEGKKIFLAPKYITEKDASKELYTVSLDNKLISSNKHIKIYKNKNRFKYFSVLFLFILFTASRSKLGIIDAETSTYFLSQHQSNLKNAVADIDSNMVNFVIDVNAIVDTNLVIPKNIHLEFTLDGLIKVSAYDTLTIFSDIKADIQQKLFVTDSTGIVYLENCPYIYPEWFGAINSDNPTEAEIDSTSLAFQRTFNSIKSYGDSNNVYALAEHPIVKLVGIYYINREIIVHYKNYLVVDGYGSWIKWDPAPSSLSSGRMFDFMGCNNLTLKGFKVDMNHNVITFARISGDSTNGTAGKSNVTYGLLKDIDFLCGWVTNSDNPILDLMYDKHTLGVSSHDDIVIDRCKFKGGKIGVRHSTSTLHFVNQCVFNYLYIGIKCYNTHQTHLNTEFTGVVYPFYIPENRHLKVELDNCYVENLHNDSYGKYCLGSLIYAESHNDPNSIGYTYAKVNIFGGLFSQGPDTLITDSTPFMDFRGCDSGQLFMDNVKFQDNPTHKVGYINLGENAVAIVNSNIESSNYSDTFPHIQGKFKFERFSQNKSFNISVNSIENEEITVCDTFSMSNASLRRFKNIDEALTYTDQLGACATVITLEDSINAVTMPINVAGSLTIKGFNGTEKLCFENRIAAKNGSNIVIENLTLKSYINEAFINRGGDIYFTDITVKNDKSKYLVKHGSGSTRFVKLTHISGGLLNCYEHGVGNVYFAQGNTYNSNEPIVNMNGSLINVVVKVVNEELPRGIWTPGVKALYDKPVADGYIGYICTKSGSGSGIWKHFGKIVNQ